MSQREFIIDGCRHVVRSSDEMLVRLLSDAEADRMSEEIEIEMDPTPSSNHALIVALEQRIAALEAQMQAMPVTPAPIVIPKDV